MKPGTSTSFLGDHYVACMKVTVHEILVDAAIDLRRSCAKMCRAAGGELEQIQLLLGHASVQTTERYLGTKQDLVHAPNNGIKLRVAV